MIDHSHIGRTWTPYETVVEAGRLKTYAKAIGETDPVHFDEAAARAAGHRSILAPTTFVFCLGFDDPTGIAYLADLSIPVARILHGEQLITHHGDLCAGDRVRYTRRVNDIYAKKGGALEFVEFDTEVRRVPGDELVAELRAVLVMRNPT